MTTIIYLAEWALRSSILILTGALLLRALRVKDPSIRLAAWAAMLIGSLAIPAMTSALPGIPLIVGHTAVQSVPAAVGGIDVSAPIPTAQFAPATVIAAPFDWTRAVLILYLLIACALLLRLAVGLFMSIRLLHRTRATGQGTEGVEIRDSDSVAAPVTLGILRPVIVLPADWNRWSEAKLNAVLAHERSHIRRFDPALQFVSAIHRALLWFGPLSWFLHSRIVRVAEDASDDAAVAATRDRASYAEVLLDFMRHGAGANHANWIGVPMARYGRADQRIHRILDSTALSRGVTRWTFLGILALGSPLAYVVAMAQPQAGKPVPASTPQPASPALAPRPAPSQPVAQRSTAGSRQAFLAGLGTVTAVTVTIRPHVEGQLLQASFKEGQLLQKGDIVAELDGRGYKARIDEAQAKVAGDERQLDLAKEREKAGLQGAEASNAIQTALVTDEGRLEFLQEEELDATIIRTPITGVAGLRQVEPGNIVRAGDPLGIVTIVQLQPISVIFTLPQAFVSQVRGYLASETGFSPTVEAWNRDSSQKLATGTLTAMDNQIDAQTGTVKLKATFENKNSALFPNQFVNVRLLTK